MSFRVSLIRSLQEIDTCVEIYNVRNPLFIKPDVAKTNFRRALRSGVFARMLLYNEEIIAWIACVRAKQLHMSEPYFNQLYFCSSRFGFQSVCLLHDDVVKNSPCDLIMSQGAYFDDKQIFARMLEKHGWNRKGSLCWLRKSDHLI
jgi:hypothetical protein